MEHQKVLVETSEPAESGGNQNEEAELGPGERAINRYKEKSGKADNQEIYFNQ
ncbi:hypothetical protein ACM16X_02295 [Haloarcula japonica]|uniref:hypothetical protein n=1 Tax=Haloarcula japonica TaxID=29282 RepID=UPI0039F7295C